MSRMEMGKKLAQEICESFVQGKFDELKILRCQYPSPFKPSYQNTFSEEYHKEQIFSQKSKAKKADKISQTLFRFFADGAFENIESLHHFLKKEKEKEKIRREVKKALYAKDSKHPLPQKDSSISSPPNGSKSFEQSNSGLPLPMDRKLPSGEPSPTLDKDTQNQNQNQQQQKQKHSNPVQQGPDQNSDSILN